LTAPGVRSIVAATDREEFQRMATRDLEPTPTSITDLRQRVARLEQENAELSRRLAEASEHQTATAAVL
jgi:uncharacterized protein YceH (UPF0502 family)